LWINDPRDLHFIFKGVLSFAIEAKLFSANPIQSGFSISAMDIKGEPSPRTKSGGLKSSKRTSYPGIRAKSAMGVPVMNYFIYLSSNKNTKQHNKELQNY
jgi:hypothetical protein